MVERRVSVRLAAVDGDRFKAELANIGREGKQALDSISGASAPASAGLGKIESAAGATLRQLEALAARAQRAAATLRAAGASTGTVAERIDQLTGVSGRFARSADDIAAYGAALNGLRAKYNPLFAVINQYKATQAEIRQAHRVGAIAADEMTAAIRRERQAALASIAAIKGRTTALGQMGMASRFARAQSRQLMFQLVDIGQAIPLAFQSPIYALQNFGFQTAQIGQLYAGQGGFTAAIRDSARMVGRFALRFAPLAALIGSVAAAIGGMTHEINQASNVTVSFGDTALATWQVMGEGIYTFLKPAIDAIAPWFAAAWDAVIAGVRIIGNAIINSFRAGFADIKFVWDHLPGVLGAAIRGAANATITGIEAMINRAIGLLNGLADRVNELLGEIPGLPENFRVGPIGAVSIGRLDESEAPDIDRILASRNARIAEIMASDPLGDFFDAVRQKAIANALARAEEAAEGAGDAIGKASGAMDRLLQQGESIRRSLRTPAEEFAETMEDLDKLHRANAISMEIYGRAAEQAAERLRELEEAERRRRLEASSNPIDGAIRALEAYSERAGDIADTIEQGITRAFQGAEDAVAQFVAKGRIDFASLVTSILADLARLSIRQAVLGPLANALRGALGQGAEGASGNGGGFLGAIATAIGGLFGGSQAAGSLHRGGRIPGGAPVLVPAAAIANAPRYHNGGGPGLRSDEQVAVLQRGERVLNRTQTREWEAAAGAQVNIYARDAQSFRQSRAQVASDIARAVAFGRRGM
tara:strand:+ start:2543 stop:4831 length:2289 start_codon:yes stop_codon:yes gene_type:complete